MLKPHFLFDELKRKFNLRNDRALSIEMGVAPPQISKVRNGSLNFSDTMILRTHEKFGIPVESIRRMLADARE